MKRFSTRRLLAELLEDVINDKERTNKINRETVWRVLVLDEKTQQILSSSTKMHQLDGIACKIRDFFSNPDSVHFEEWGMRTGVLTRKSSMNFIFANFSVVEPMFKTTEDGKMVARNREPIQNFEAIYFICPTEQAVDALISDFEEPNNFRNSENLYKSAHIYFTTGS